MEATEFTKEERLFNLIQMRLAGACFRKPRSAFAKAIASGELHPVKIGRRTYFTKWELANWAGKEFLERNVSVEDALQLLSYYAGYEMGVNKGIKICREAFKEGRPL